MSITDDHSLPGINDWTSYYRESLSLRSVLVGKSKGRTIKALRERVDKLCASKETRTEGLTLSRYHDQVKRACAWRGGHTIFGMTDETFKQDLDMFSANGVVLPADICECLVTKASQTHSVNRNWKQFLETVLPFGGDPAKFDCRFPRLRDLPRLPGWLLKASAAALFDEVLNPILFEEQVGSGKAASICETALVIMEDQDLGGASS